MKPITSRQNPFVLRCRELARRRVDGIILLDGQHLVEEARKAGLRVEAAAAGPRLAGEPAVARMLAELEAEGAEVFAATESVMEAASPVRSPSGLVAVARFDLAGPQQVFRPGSDLVVAGVGLQDPGNVGALTRVADAAGSSGLVFSAGSADPLGWKALRASSGSAFRVPMATGISPEETCAAARAAGLRVVATCPATGSDLHETDLTGPLLVLMGGEGPGLPADLIRSAEARLRIPMREPVESLNVAVAAGIVLFEAVRQRRARR